jgi:hypothetical protein
MVSGTVIDALSLASREIDSLAAYLQFRPTLSAFCQNLSLAKLFR